MIITVALEGSLLLSVLGVGGGGGYSIYGPNSYVPPIRVLFLRVRTLNKGFIFTHLGVMFSLFS